MNYDILFQLDYLKKIKVQKSMRIMLKSNAQFSDYTCNSHIWENQIDICHNMAIGAVPKGFQVPTRQWY